MSDGPSDRARLIGAACGPLSVIEVATLMQAAKPDLGTDPVGRKNDVGKRRMDLIPPEAVEALADVLTMGAAKYADRNWENGFAWGRAVAALLRHLFAWMRGEDKDLESGMSHMAHVLCNAAFLVTFEVRKIGTDDRPFFARDGRLGRDVP